MSFYISLLRILPLAFLRSIAKVAAYIINQNPNKSMLWKTRVNIGLAYPELSQEQKERLALRIPVFSLPVTLRHCARSISPLNFHAYFKNLIKNSWKKKN